MLARISLMIYAVDRARREHAEAQSALAWAIPLITDAAAHQRSSDDWSVATNLAHLTVYEERLAVPVLEAAVRGEDGADLVRSGEEGWLVHDAESLAANAFLEIAARYQVVGAKHAQLLTLFDDVSINVPVCSLWGARGGVLVSAGWVAKKSLQHTWEHGHALIRAGLVGAVRR